MSPYNLLCLCTSPCFLYPTDVKRAVLPLEATDTTHIVSVVRKLVSRKAVLGGIGERSGRVGKHVEVFAFPAVRASTPSEEEAAIVDAGCVGAGEALVPFDVAAGLGFCFAGSLLVLLLR